MFSEVQPVPASPSALTGWRSCCIRMRIPISGLRSPWKWGALPAVLWCRGWDDWWVWSGTAGTRDISAHGLEELLSCRSRVGAGTGSVPRLAQHSEGSLRTHAFTPGFQREGHKCTGCSECFQHLRADQLSFTWNWWMSKGSQSMGYAKIYLDSCGHSQTMANLLLPQIFSC